MPLEYVVILSNDWCASYVCAQHGGGGALVFGDGWQVAGCSGELGGVQGVQALVFTGYERMRTTFANFWINMVR